jgi:hypothetical protein
MMSTSAAVNVSSVLLALPLLSISFFKVNLSDRYSREVTSSVSGFLPDVSLSVLMLCGLLKSVGLTAFVSVDRLLFGVKNFPGFYVI